MQTLYTWGSIAVMVLASTSGDVLMSRAMKKLGDLGELRKQRGLWHVVGRFALNPDVYLAVTFMALAFFTLLFALSWADVSLVVPAAASLSFVTNALAAKLFLHENVDRRRWAAAVLVCCGVALLAA
ncbi:MAG TPA: EamA family transporter [Terriglobales bacterium]|nr:EamA family transporter [Terriglobales bacterium]